MQLNYYCCIILQDYLLYESTKPESVMKYGGRTSE
jgi:hypothetical protein